MEFIVAMAPITSVLHFKLALHNASKSDALAKGEDVQRVGYAADLRCHLLNTLPNEWVMILMPLLHRDITLAQLGLKRLGSLFLTRYFQSSGRLKNWDAAVVRISI
jgi:hypothetical protein